MRKHCISHEYDESEELNQRQYKDTDQGTQDPIWHLWLKWKSSDPKRTSRAEKQSGISMSSMGSWRSKTLTYGDGAAQRLPYMDDTSA